MTTGGEALTTILDARGEAPDWGLFGLWNEELSKALREFGLPSYRIRQLETALYRQKVADIREVTTWPKPLREQVVEGGFRVGLPEIVDTFRSEDGTERYLIAGRDG